MKTRKWIMLLLILSCSLSLLTSCKFGGKNLLIHEVDGRFYVEFAQTYEYEPNDTAHRTMLWFPSVAVLQKGFLEDMLREETIRSFQDVMREKEYGYPICNLKNMYNPDIPLDVHMYTEVALCEGANYQFRCEWGSYSGTITFWSPEELESELDRIDPGRFADPEEFMVEEISYHGQKANYYRFFEDEKVHHKTYWYTISDGEDLLHIQETYVDPKKEGDYLSNLKIIRVCSDEKSFGVSFIRSNRESPDEELRPEITLEWLTGFNSKAYPYVPGREINPEDWDLSPGYHGVMSLKEEK